MLHFTKPLSSAVPLIIILAAPLICAADRTDPNVAFGIGDVDDGSLAPVIHRISLYDDKGFVIFPQINLNEPFSTIQTCARCHNYDIITTGWHFNALDPNVDPGRPGEPWIYWDCSAATQIPLSYRPWPGTFKPQQLRLTRWWFTRTFGRHMPGGGPGMKAPSADPDPRDRWRFSGQLEINCLSCHNNEPAHDQAEFAQQIAKHNFRWAAAASCGFATVEGSAKDLPDFWLPGDDSENLPTVSYDRTRFLPGRKVFVDIVKEVPDKRCYFCHSTRIVGATEPHVKDVHLAAGIKCIDCHKNGLDHATVRGYEGEPAENGPTPTALSCRGCHLGEEELSQPIAGGLGAPVPKHKGIPLVHFEKLACTACHSGPWPKNIPFATKTSRAHALGTAAANKQDGTLPLIQSPVFARRQDNRIGPHRMLWPAFWAVLNEDGVTPIAPQVVKQAAGKSLYLSVELDSPSWPELTGEMVAQVLTALKSGLSLKGEPVYIAGGMIHRLVAGKIIASDHDAARPCLWPLAHDVRPAAQSLGAGGCGDCHYKDKPFIFGKVPVDSPLASDRQHPKEMTDFQNADPLYARLFATSFVFRPLFKIVSLAASAVLAAIVLLYGVRALACALSVLAATDCRMTARPPESQTHPKPLPDRLLLTLKLLKSITYFFGVVSFLVLATTGLWPILFGKSLSGYCLMAHATAAPVFAACLAAIALFRADRHTFKPPTTLKPADRQAASDYLCPCQKIIFWLIVLMALPLIMSIVLMMFPLFAAQTQQRLLLIHRYAAIFLGIAVIFYSCLWLVHKVIMKNKNT